ncbi:coat protein [ssRNA phage Gerhypos.4_41]|jgi:hypothetical protein|uniref:Coat protein n=2 Tax=Leviviricetes TaxID=2842243 RepID=A0A8S5KZZ6_9VIRU|nr:coat protein [ssRNA phage Gerhypos.4_41]QDH90271.1 MAG: hypothetical protein H4Bulk46722_000002 [Leviviridae sp.]DAD51278.1 TPA_asm: coat protein [ssRNA phage Gerhypos.4_41]
MFADPQSVTYATVAKSLPAIGRAESQSEYRLDDSGTVYDLTVSHQFKNRNRVVARLRRDTVVTNPLSSSNNIAASATATFTLDFPTSGLSTTDAQNLGNALVGWLTSANILKMANGET